MPRAKQLRAHEFQVVLTPDPEAGGYVVSCPSLPGCYSQGDTVEEAMANIKEAIELTIEDMKDHGEPIPGKAPSLIGSVVVEA